MQDSANVSPSILGVPSQSRTNRVKGALVQTEVGSMIARENGWVGVTDSGLRRYGFMQNRCSPPRPQSPTAANGNNEEPMALSHPSNVATA